MPTTIEELEAAIQDNISQANSVFCLNGTNILLEYEDRRRQVFFCYLLFFLVLLSKPHPYCIKLQMETISEKLEADNNKLQKCLAEIDALKVREVPLLLLYVGLAAL